MSDKLSKIFDLSALMSFYSMGTDSEQIRVQYTTDNDLAESLKQTAKVREEYLTKAEEKRNRKMLKRIKNDT